MARAIKISSVSGALTVAITGPNGGTPTVYSDSSFINTQTMPATIADTATTTFWLQGPGRYTLSVKTAGGTEIAADNNSTRTVDVETDGTVAALNYDARTLATVSGDSGHSTAGSAASGLPQVIVSKTANYTAAAGEFVECDTTSAGFTVTLPSAPAIGALVAVKKISNDTNTLTIAPAGAGTVEGQATATTITQWAGVIVEHKGSDVWRIAASMSTTGPAGTNGNTVLTTSGAPSSGTGQNGDYAIDPTAHVIYGPKAAGTWPSGVQMLGAITTIQAAGVDQTVRAKLNFTGTAVTVTDDSGNGRTNIAIAGGGSGILPGSLPSGVYVTTPATIANVVASQNYVTFVPFQVFVSTSFTSIGINLQSGTAGATVQLGVYTDSNGRPGTLVFQAAGSVDASTSGDKELSITQTLAAGVYWLAAAPRGNTVNINVSRNTPAVIGCTAISGATQNSRSGMSDGGGSTTNLPTNPSGLTDSNNPIRVVLKTA